MGSIYSGAFEDWEVAIARKISSEFLTRYSWIKGYDLDDLVQECLLQKTLEEELQFRSKNADYIPGRSDDCQAAKKRLTELAMQAPKNGEGKKMTVEEAKAWLERQRTEDKELVEASTKQRMAEFTAGDFTIKIEMLRTKLNDYRAVLSLRTAQITFFAGDVRTSLPLEEEIKQEAGK